MLFYKKTHRIRHCVELLALLALIGGGYGVYHHFHDSQNSQPRTERTAPSQQNSAQSRKPQAKPQQQRNPNNQHRHIDANKARANASNSFKSYWQRNRKSIIALAVIFLFVLGILTS